MASINWSTWMLTPSLSLVPITAILRRVKYYKPHRLVECKLLYFAFVNIGSTPIQSWSVIWGIPDNTHAFNWGPCRDKNLWSASSVKLSDESRSSAIKLRALPISIQDFKTESLKPLFCPAAKNLNESFRFDHFCGRNESIFFTLNSVFELTNR